MVDAFLKFCHQNLWHFENVPIKCPKWYIYRSIYIYIYLYIYIYIYISISEEHLQKNSSLHFMSPVSFQASKVLMIFRNFFMELFWKSFSGRNSSLKPSVSLFLTVFYMVWKNQESWEIGLDGFWSNRHSKTQNIFCWQILFAVLSCHYGFRNCFEILNFVFF